MKNEAIEALDNLQSCFYMEWTSAADNLFETIRQALPRESVDVEGLKKNVVKGLGINIAGDEAGVIYDCIDYLAAQGYLSNSRLTKIDLDTMRKNVYKKSILYDPTADEAHNNCLDRLQQQYPNGIYGEKLLEEIE